MAVFRIDRVEHRKKIPGYGGRYEVSDLGRVFSGVFEMSLIDGRYVKLCRKGEVSRVDVAYLVARAFIPNVEARPYVIRKDGDVRNNRKENLEWSETPRKRKAPTRRSRRVAQYDLEGVFLASYDDVKSASEGSGVPSYLIRNCLSGKTRRAKQYVFRYV